MAGRPRGGGHDHQLAELLTFFDFSIFFLFKGCEEAHPFTMYYFCFTQEILIYIPDMYWWGDPDQPQSTDPP